MHVTTYGASDRPPLVLLHGGIGTGSYHWGRQADALEDLFHVHLPDLPGHGQSPIDDSASYNRETLVSAVGSLLEELEPPVHVGGFSMGGHTALALAERRPELFKSLLLIGVSFREHDGLKAWRKLFQPDNLEKVYPFWAKQLSKIHAPLGSEDSWRGVCLRDSQGMAVDVDVEQLKAIDGPVLLMRGDRDNTVEAEQYADLRATFLNSEEAVIPAGGHDVQLTRADVVKPLLRDFYERVLKNFAEPGSTKRTADLRTEN